MAYSKLIANLKLVYFKERLTKNPSRGRILDNKKDAKRRLLKHPLLAVLFQIFQGEVIKKTSPFHLRYCFQQKPPSVSLAVSSISFWPFLSSIFFKLFSEISWRTFCLCVFCIPCTRKALYLYYRSWRRLFQPRPPGSFALPPPCWPIARRGRKALL